MTIRPGQAWGEPVELTGDEAVFESDADVAVAMAAAVEAAGAAQRDGDGRTRASGDDGHGRHGASAGEPATGQGLGGIPAGDPARTPAAPAAIPHRVPLDLLAVDVDGHRMYAAAHVVIRGPAWSGECVVVMNAAFLGAWNLGPRAHPNDGLADITAGSLSLRERLQARVRARSGTHVPHPRLATRRARGDGWELPRGRSVYVDGRRVARSARRVAVEVIPDAAVLAF